MPEFDARVTASPPVLRPDNQPAAEATLVEQSDGGPAELMAPVASRAQTSGMVEFGPHTFCAGN
jgi:hypothetical protein